MDNILPGFRKHHQEEEEYLRAAPPRSTYATGYGGPYEYTGQPVGFEHLGSPPKHKLSELDAKTIAQLGYEGPEGERRKVEAINEQLYEREYEREREHERPVYVHPPRPEPYGYSDEYGRNERRGHRHGGGSSHSHGRRDSDSDEEYAGSDERYRRANRLPVDERYGHGRPGYIVQPPVHVERKYEEDGTVVERIFPENSAGTTYGRTDPAKIHYGRQDSFPEAVLQEAAYAHGRREYPVEYERASPRYAPPYNEATTYVRRPGYEGTLPEYDERYPRRY